jgi:hypothetical protein
MADGYPAIKPLEERKVLLHLIGFQPFLEERQGLV